MKIISINIGEPHEITSEDRTINTGIFKYPVKGPVMLHKLNFDGDAQADLTLHGGVNRAVYMYPAEHYAYWRGELPSIQLPWGAIGENLTTEGLSEDVVNIGDCFRIGTAEVMVTEPRFPCFKLGIRLGRPDMVKRFLRSRRTGFFCSVLREGEVEVGNSIELITAGEDNIKVSEITRLFAFDKDDLEAMEKIVRASSLPDNWRSYFANRLAKIKQQSHPS